MPTWVQLAGAWAFEGAASAAMKASAARAFEQFLNIMEPPIGGWSSHRSAGGAIGNDDAALAAIFETP
jgi:hypothetical protein